MDALKLIPQSFFEFFARLVPGGVAFAIWMTLFNGAYRWPAILETLAAGRLDHGNVSTFAFVVALSIAYGLGQLVAPLGKVAQRVSEFLAVPAASILIGPRNWARAVMGKDPVKLPERKKAAVAPVASGADAQAASRKKEKGGDYDYLRANASELGALVGKIRSEYTMFYSLTAILAFAAVAYLAVQPDGLWPALPLLLGAAIVCACRGYFVGKTMNETAKKLRTAFDQVRRSKPSPGGAAS